MKLFAVHKDGKLTDLYDAFCGKDKTKAEQRFRVEYGFPPENARLELVEYAPVTATEKLMEAIKSASDTINLSPQDWSIDKRSAWLYGLFVGWSDEALDEITCLQPMDKIRLITLREAIAAYEATK